MPSFNAYFTQQIRFSCKWIKLSNYTTSSNSLDHIYLLHFLLSYNFTINSLWLVQCTLPWRAADGGCYLDHAAVRLVVGPHHRAEVCRGHGEGEAEAEGEEGECQHVPGMPALDGATLAVCTGHTGHYYCRTAHVPARPGSGPASDTPPLHRHHPPPPSSGKW